LTGGIIVGIEAGVRHYFIEAFTPYGYISLLPELLKEKEHTYLLTGGPGTGKSTMIKLTGIQLIDRGYDVDYIRSAREPDSVAGFYLPKHKICLLDKNEFQTDKIDFQSDYHREIDFNAFCRKSKLEQQKPQIEEIENKLNELEKALIVQLGDDYGEEYNAKDYEEINVVKTFLSLNKSLDVNDKENTSLSVDEISDILSKIKKNYLTFYFLHGLHIDRWLNLAPRYLKDYDRICLEVEDSTEMLREILNEVKCLGQVIEIIVHPLKPYTIVGIIFPEKNLAVWEGNPCKLEEQGFQLKHSLNTTKILEEYRSSRIKLKSLINDTVNFRGLDDMRSELLSSILADLHK